MESVLSFFDVFRPLGEPSYTSHNIPFTNNFRNTMRKWAVFCLGSFSTFLLPLNLRTSVLVICICLYMHVDQKIILSTGSAKLTKTTSLTQSRNFTRLSGKCYFPISGAIKKRARNRARFCSCLGNLRKLLYHHIDRVWLSNVACGPVWGE